MSPAEIARRTRCMEHWNALSPEERDLRRLFTETGVCRTAVDCCERPIHVSLVQGVYDGPFGFMITVEGSPPHGCLWVECGGPTGIQVVLSIEPLSGKTKRLHPRRGGCGLSERSKRVASVVLNYLRHVAAIPPETAT
jgi:hypothetical protein